MTIDPTVAATLAVAIQLLVVASVQKGTLKWRRSPRRCPSCGLDATTDCRCGTRRARHAPRWRLF
jgi:hypothetical protein